MDLTLSVIRYRDHPPDQPLTASITELGGRVGRSPDNDLVLPDADCWVSGHHADIRFREGKFFLTDRSTNGTYLNETPDRLPPGEIQLHDGDKLGIGAYLLRVGIAASEPPPQSAAIDDSLLWDAMEDETPVAFALRQAPLDLQDPLSPGPEAAAPAVHQAPDRGIRALDEGNERAIPESEPEPRPEPGPEPASESESEHRRIPAVSTPSDSHKPVERPDPAAEGGAACDAGGPPPHPRRPMPAPGNPSPDPAGPTTVGAEAAQARPERRPEEMPEPALAPEPAAAPQPVPASESMADSFDQQRQYLAALEAFAEGLGGSKLPQDPEAQARLMRAAGILLRILTEGLMTLLMTRAGFKSEMRLAMTRIRPTGNNPFKLCVDVDDILTYLLLQPRRGFLPPVDAAREALEDVEAHQAAMAAGVQAAVEALLARFEPAGIERLLAKQSPLKALVPRAKKAKYWDRLSEVHADLAGESADGLLTLFREDFSRAYEARLKEMKSSGGKRRR
jgi:type VI secretion system protein